MGKGFFRKELTQTGSPFKLKPGQYILRLLTAWFFGAFAAVLVGDYNAFLSPLLEKVRFSRCSSSALSYLSAPAF